MLKAAKTVGFVLIAGVLSQYAKADERSSASGRQYDICRAQIEEYLEKRFDQTVSRIDFDFVFDHKSVGSGDGPKSTALAYTEECPGYHVFEVFATDFDCDARAYIGTVPNYVIYRTSEDGC